jgi:tetratricopeptide (TPR) repeat protein
MREDRVAGLRRFGNWISAGREQAAPLVSELLEHEPMEWDSWLTGRPEARSVQLFEGLLQVAEADAPRSLPLTEFVLRHVDSVAVPPEADLALLFVRGHARRVRAFALLKANDPGAALRAYDDAAAIFRTEPVARRELALVETAAASLRPDVAARLLAETPFSEWPGLAAREELQNAEALQELSRQVGARSDSVPLESLAIAGLAAAIADSLSRQGREQVVAELRAQAWKDLGVVYRCLARFSDSLAAIDTADAILQPFGRLKHQSAILQLARAGTLDEAGHHDAAMSLVHAARSAFGQAGDTRRLFLCGILEGAILQHSGHHRDAVLLYESLLEDPRGRNDPDLEATLHNNAGHALVELGEFAAAGEHLGEAAALFNRLGRPLKVAMTQLARARMLVRQGNIEEGLAQLHSARGQFLSRNLVEEAGLCGLDIVEAHLSRGAAIEAEAFARQIVREFTAAQLNTRAITALQYLSEAVAMRNASVATVGNVREFIHSLRQKPDAEFKVPA